MERFVMICGPQAVGKMTVGQALAKRTELKLLHNHMTIELLEPLYGFTPEMFRLSNLFRREIFKSYAQSDNKGLIFTVVWAFDQKEDWDEIEAIRKTFIEQGVEMYLVELEADVETRVSRNKTPNRLEQKPTKRNVEASETELRTSMEKHRLNSYEGEVPYENYLRINNTDLTADGVAEQIIAHFSI